MKYLKKIIKTEITVEDEKAILYLLNTVNNDNILLLKLKNNIQFYELGDSTNNPKNKYEDLVRLAFSDDLTLVKLSGAYGLGAYVREIGKTELDRIIKDKIIAEL